MGETKYAVMDRRGHIYNSFLTKAEAIAYLTSGRSWVKDCAVAKITLEYPRDAALKWAPSKDRPEA